MKGSCLVDRKVSPGNPSLSGSQLSLLADLRLSNTIGKDDRSLSVQKDAWLARHLHFTSSTSFLPCPLEIFFVLVRNIRRVVFLTFFFYLFIFFPSTLPHSIFNAKMLLVPLLLQLSLLCYLGWVVTAKLTFISPTRGDEWTFGNSYTIAW